MMLRAYSVFKDLDKKACEILTNAGIELELSTCWMCIKYAIPLLKKSNMPRIINIASR